MPACGEDFRFHKNLVITIVRWHRQRKCNEYDIGMIQDKGGNDSVIDNENHHEDVEEKNIEECVY